MNGKNTFKIKIGKLTSNTLSTKYNEFSQLLLKYKGNNPVVEPLRFFQQPKISDWDK